MSTTTDVDLDELAPSADLVRVYLNEIGRTPLLTAEQEVDLAKRIESGVYAAELLRRRENGEKAPKGARRSRLSQGDLRALAADGERAKAHMLRANLRLVVSVAKKFSQRGVPFLDVVQEGNLGLIRAVEKFDYRKGYKFSTYAMWWVRQAIGRGLAEQARTIRLPVHVTEELARLARVERQFAQDHTDEPSLEALATELDMPVERVEYLRQVRRDTLSLDTPVGDDQETVLGELMADPGEVSASDVLEHRAMVGHLSDAIDRLPEREALILRMRYGLHDGRPRTLDEIGRHLGLTRERVRQLEKLAMSRLRHPSASEGLLEWAS
jgi:RNA polymerase primary sigma factor